VQDSDDRAPDEFDLERGARDRERIIKPRTAAHPDPGMRLLQAGTVGSRK
jgi:hypothetical protein